MGVIRGSVSGASPALPVKAEPEPATWPKPWPSRSASLPLVQMMRILALDYGEKRIGLAISDELGWTAQGLPTLVRQGTKRDIATLVDLVRDSNVDEVVVGLPYRQDGTLGLSGERVLVFIDRLSGQLSLPVTSWDERLTTKMAERLLIEGGVSREKRKLSRDRVAATLILQSYLDARATRPSLPTDPSSDPARNAPST